MTVRRIAPMILPGLTPGGADMAEPEFGMLDPRTLLVDETYQRNLSTRSIKLIRRIVANWDWRTFMPPVVVQMPEGGYHVIDGQHTAIAAASHPAIKMIPVMLVKADGVVDRARAFLGRNRDRITVTPNQLHYAAVAAGDVDAVRIHEVCTKAGVRILKTGPGSSWYKANDTMAIAAVSVLVRRRGVSQATRILKTIAAAKLTPIPSDVIKAVEEVMFKYREIDPFVISNVLRDSSETLQNSARMLAARRECNLWTALVEIILKRCTNDTNTGQAA